MPSITLLQPEVLNGVLSSIDPPEEFVGLSLMGTPVPSPYPTVEYDTRMAVREMALMNIPNAEANIVPKMGYGRVQAGYVYTREKKTFEPTATQWIAQAGNPRARANAEQAIIEDLRDLRTRVDRRKEWSVWQMFTGKITWGSPPNMGGGTVTTDYKLKASHTPVLASTDKWNYTDGQGKYTAPVRSTIAGLKMLMNRDAHAPITDAYMNATTMDVFYRNEEFKGNNISDRQRDAFLTQDSIPGLYGINWNVYDGGYLDETTGVYTPYIPDGVVIFLSRVNRPWEMREGPTADFGAPAGSTGMWAKTWEEPDPSGIQALVEANFFPVLWRPDSVIRAKVF